MGFRGEALFSMACLSEKLVVATRTEDDELAQKLEFGRDGSLIEDSISSLHRKVGTTVAVIQPFSALPARRVDMMRRVRPERSRLFKLMESCKYILTTGDLLHCELLTFKSLMNVYRCYL